MLTPSITGATLATWAGEYRRFFLWAAYLGAALGGLMFGCDWVVSGGADIFLIAAGLFTVSSAAAARGSEDRGSLHECAPLSEGDPD